MTQENQWPLGKSAAMGALVVAVLLGVFDFADRMIIGSIFPHLKEHYGVTDTQLGMLAGVINWVIAVLVVPCGILVDRWSRKKMVAIMMVIWAIGSGLTFLVPNMGTAATAGTVGAGFGVLVAARALIGFGESAYTPAMQSLLSVSFPMRWRSTAVGMQQYGTNLGCMIGIAVGAFVAGKWGWQHALGLMCIPGLIVGLSALKLTDYPNAPRSAEGKGPGIGATIASLFKRKSLVYVYCAQALSLCFNYTLSLWLITYLTRVAGMEHGRASFFTVLLLVCSSTSLLVSGPFLDWLRSKSRVFAIRVIGLFILVSFLCTFIAFYCLDPGHGLQIVMIFAGAVFSIPMVCMNFALNADLTRVEERGTSTSLLLVIMNIVGAGGGPVILGLLSDRFELNNAIIMLSFCVLAAAAFYFFLSFSYQRDLPKK